MNHESAIWDRNGIRPRAEESKSQGQVPTCKSLPDKEELLKDTKTKQKRHPCNHHHPNHIKPDRFH